MTSGTLEMFFTCKKEVAGFNLQIRNNWFFVIFLWYIFETDYNKGKDVVQKGWKCIFDFSSTLRDLEAWEICH